MDSGKYYYFKATLNHWLKVTVLISLVPHKKNLAKVLPSFEHSSTSFAPFIMVANIVLVANKSISSLDVSVTAEPEISFCVLDSVVSDTKFASILVTCVFANTVEPKIDMNTNNTTYSKCLVFCGSIGVKSCLEEYVGFGT